MKYYVINVVWHFIDELLGSFKKNSRQFKSTTPNFKKLLKSTILVYKFLSQYYAPNLIENTYSLNLQIEYFGRWDLICVYWLFLTQNIYFMLKFWKRNIS